MSKLTQGTQVYFVDPDTNAVTKVEGVSTLNPGGAPADQIDDTDLDADAKTYKRGMRSPNQAAMTLFADPEKASHVRLHELSEGIANENMKFAVGWSDGKDIAPTADSNGDFVLPVDSDDKYTRTWYLFDGYVADFPFDFSINTVVASSVSVQRSGTGTWKQKGATAV